MPKVEHVISKRHFYAKVRSWAGEHSLTVTVVFGRRHLTFNLVVAW
jgi:hypothetical protein